MQKQTRKKKKSLLPEQGEWARELSREPEEEKPLRRGIGIRFGGNLGMVKAKLSNSKRKKNLGKKKQRERIPKRLNINSALVVS